MSQTLRFILTRTIHVYSLKLANAAPQALTNNSDRYDLVNLSTSHVVASNLRPDEIFFEDEGLIIRKRQTGAPMPENGHLDIVNDVDEEGGAKKVAVTGPVEVPTVIPVFRVRWA